MPPAAAQPVFALDPMGYAPERLRVSTGSRQLSAVQVKPVFECGFYVIGQRSAFRLDGRIEVIGQADAMALARSGDLRRGFSSSTADEASSRSHVGEGGPARRFPERQDHSRFWAEARCRTARKRTGWFR
jgi:hypothetical protein